MEDNLYANFVGIIYGKQNQTSGKEISVVGSLPIKVTKTETEGQVQYHVQYYEYKAPSITLVVTPAYAQVGDTVNADFLATYAKGSEDIDYITVSPELTPTITDTTIGFTVNNITSDTKGVAGTHSITLFDVAGKSATVSGGVIFQNTYSYGFIPRGGDVSQFIPSESILGDSVRGVFGNDRVYTFPTGDHHLAWLIPSDEDINLVTGDANMEWTTTLAGTTTVTNGASSIVYKCVRTLNDYPGTSEPVTLRVN